MVHFSLHTNKYLGVNRAMTRVPFVSTKPTFNMTNRTKLFGQILNHPAVDHVDLLVY